MIFDSLASMVETYFPHLRQFVESSKLFVFNDYAHKFLPKQANQKMLELQEMFFLPFPIVAIEDKTSCVILWTDDTEKLGVEKKWNFIECMPSDITVKKEDLRNSEKEYLDFINAAKEYFPPKTSMFHFGVFEIEKWTPDCEIIFKGKIIDGLVGNKKQVIQRKEYVNFCNSYIGSIMPNVKTALEEILYINNPDRFVLEISNVKNKKKGKGKKITRSQNKEQYILLKPEEIRTKMHLPSDKKVKGHDVRSHIRRYKHSKFSEEVRNKVYKISAHWRGPKENVVGKKRYRIMLEI